LGVDDGGALQTKINAMRTLSNKEGRSLKDDEDVDIPGVGRISHFNNKIFGFGVSKYTYSDENENPLSHDEFMKRLKAARDAARIELEALEGTGDQSSNSLNTSSSEVALNGIGQSQVVVISSSDTGSTRQKSSQGLDIPIGTPSSDAVPPWLQVGQFARMA